MKRLFFACVACAATSAFAGIEVVEISAPVFPKVSVLYTQEGANFPSTLEGEKQLVADAALTYDTLLTECAPLYPDIVLPTAGAMLTQEQSAKNYASLAQCAYEHFTSKPYWIPALIDHVDICQEQLGTGWRLPTAADLANLTKADFEFFQQALSTAASTNSFFGAFYFSLKIFIRGDDGTIQTGDLTPDLSSRTAPLSVSGEELKKHYEGGIALRCIRRSQQP